ncbi:MAG: DUF488 domain-containing protein [Candidatus Omnitrophica bacterium]|nr:DUF488 domain-containing protein [Candidatus Omnitrophota bacterium]
MIKDNRIIYTLGTSNRSLEEFLEILKNYSIKLIVDVRRFPTSRFEHFKREKLKDYLSEENIKYFYLGDKLGGYRQEGYEKYTKTSDFKRAIEILKELSKKENICIICAEKFPFRCHRRFISEELSKDKDIGIIHIIDK